MSIETVGARIAAIDELFRPSPVAPAIAAGPAAAAPKADFGAALAAASGAAPTTAAAEPTGDQSQYDSLIERSAATHGIDPALLKGLIKQESNFNPGAGSPAGAVGLTQLMASTAEGLGVTDRTDPAQSIDGGARYLRQQLDRFGGDTSKALAAYNAGPGAVEKFGGVPPYIETQNYVQAVMAGAERYRSAPAMSVARGSMSLPTPPLAPAAPVSSPTVPITLPYTTT